MTEHYQAGDQVRLLVATHGRHGPQPGQLATVVVGDELGAYSSLAVVLDSTAEAPSAKAWEVYRHQVVLVARALVAVAG